ncbi:MAG: hypothetical protein AAF939_19325 [Planctomycetota bacterium]
MKLKGIVVCLTAFTLGLLAYSESQAQLGSRLLHRGGVIYGGKDAEGMVMAEYSGRIGIPKTIKMAAGNKFSPQRIYTYSNNGLAAQHTHQWNQEQAAGLSWHDNYSYWRFGTPTALVVPPTASYETEYAWGVGQTRSTPIHSQFGRMGAGMIGGGAGGAQQAPYWPSSTRQYGIYPVRAPW